MNGRGAVKDVVSFVKARKAQQAANLANGDISSLVNTISTLQQQVADIADQVAAMQVSYDAHTHNYTDVDNLGSTLTKATQSHN